MQGVSPDSVGLRAAVARTAVPDKAYCGDPDVIRGLLQSLAAGVVERVAHVANQILSESSAKDRDHEAIVAFSDILMGRNDAYVTVGHWHPVGLASAIRDAMREDVPDAHLLNDEVVIQRAVTKIVLSLYALLSAFPSHRSQSDLQHSIEQMLHKHTLVFLGLPAEPTASDV